ncbi:hypothetical protein DSO57_1009072 [Entomophthora muscae]|uniref:Uncharacterized protein n=1 Tax=Entomophthora muscae TaxID=34485 RepID=A0ACC2RLK7_9FUNG|nr:hypothetical protein DSO57_1009072 [Entomophthora muscae]
MFGRFAYLGNLGHLAMVTLSIGLVPMPCKPTTNQYLGLPELTKPTQKCISDIKCIILIRLMQESGDYKEAAALVGVDPKYASKVYNTIINTD